MKRPNESQKGPPAVQCGARNCNPKMSLRPNARTEVRKKSYKLAVDADEARRKREDNMVEIRRNKREESLLKKRREGMQTQQFSSTVHSSATEKKLESLPAMVAGVWSDDGAAQLDATTHFRKLLSIERSPPNEEVMAAGVVPRVVEFLVRSDFPQLQDSWPSGKKRKGEFRYGNYNRYYGYRVGKTLDEDPRLKLFRKEWFEGKDCLDVGCNEGSVTIAVAQKFSCGSMLGVDIDGDLIQKAIRALKPDCQNDRLQEGRLMEEGGICKTCHNVSKRCREEKEPQAATHTDERVGCICSESLRKRVKFKEEQFIEDFPHGNYRKDGLFDTVLCLSVTKWIHLNWGDRGLIRLFAKIHHILRPGGLLILEPQPWKSYKSKCHVSKDARRCFKEIQIFPKHFKEILLDKIGFKSVEEISQAVPDSNVGFKRPLFLYVK